MVQRELEIMEVLGVLLEDGEEEVDLEVVLEALGEVTSQGLLLNVSDATS